MNESSVVLAMLMRLDAVKAGGHFVLGSSSGKHSSVYIDPDAIYPHTRETSGFGLEIAEQFLPDRVDIVLSLTMGSIILSHLVADHLNRMLGYEVLGIYAEKARDGDAFAIKHDYDKLVPGKRVLVVGDVLTTGSSVKKVIGLVRLLEGDVVGLGVIYNRGQVKKGELEISKLVALGSLPLDDWNEADCPLCKQKIPVNTNVGYGRDFLKRKKKFA